MRAGAPRLQPQPRPQPIPRARPTHGRPPRLHPSTRPAGGPARPAPSSTKTPTTPQFVTKTDGRNDTVIAVNGKFRLYKKNAHASYYADKFNGRKTASGKKFSNKRYTAAHRKLPFGTILRVTNEANGECVLVEVNDRGPFVRGREIDLSKRAFMEIAKNKNSGSIIVKIEEAN